MALGRILVIGAGIAGLAAAKSLHERGYEVTVLEARSRIGGRLWTDRAFAGMPIELGGEFVHGAEVSTWSYLRAAGLATIARGDYSSKMYQLHGQLLHYRTLADQPDFRRLFGMESREYLEFNPSGHDCSFRDWILLQRLTNEASAFASRFFSHQYLAEPHEISFASMAYEEQSHRQGSDDFHIADGYEALTAYMAKDLQICLDSPVESVHWNDNGVSVDLPNAPRAYSADRILLTVPFPILAPERMRFFPELPSHKISAIRKLRMGAGTKLHFVFHSRFWDENVGEFFSEGDVSMWWSPSNGRSDTMPILTGLLGGDRARLYDSLSEDECVDRALTELCTLFGSDRPRKEFAKGMRTSWGDDRYALGAYSHVPVGAHGARHDLARPLGKTVFFAGEATVVESSPGTVHGAIDSALRAVREIEQSVLKPVA